MFIYRLKKFNFGEGRILLILFILLLLFLRFFSTHIFKLIIYYVTCSIPFIPFFPFFFFSQSLFLAVSPLLSSFSLFLFFSSSLTSDCIFIFLPIYFRIYIYDLIHTIFTFFILLSQIIVR